MSEISHAVKNRARGPQKYYIGQVIGSWTILSHETQNKWCHYVCRCVCGTIRRLGTSHIRRRKGCSECDVTIRRMTATGLPTPPRSFEVRLDGSRVRAEDVRKAVGRFYKISDETLFGARKYREVVWPRMIAIALMRELTALSTTSIGLRCGGRDHSTVLHAIDRVAELRRSNPVVDEEYTALRALLTYRPANDAEAA